MKKYLLTSSQKQWLKKYFKNNNIHLKTINLEGLIYLLKTGCRWRLLPEYYGAWQTVYYYFITLGDKDVFSKIKRKLLENKRIKSGKRKSPSVAVIDSQSVRSGLSKSEKALMETRKSRASSGIFLWILPEIRLKSSSREQIFTTQKCLPHSFSED